ncbi:MAG: peptidoglycan DD-metalloendopeptidase family protein, partial [Gaiellaceae bacterium]
MKRLVALLPVLIALQAGVPPALAWTWPVDGPVLRPFVLGDDPYAAGQHRGIDLGAGAGVAVRAPAAGAVTFAGTVPGGGRTVTIQTSDGYSVTLVHLGSLGVGRGAAVAEGSAVGTVGPSGEPELAEPYVHLGVRRTADEHGYLDPLALLPAVASDPPSEAESPVQDPAPDEPAEAAPPAGTPASDQPEEATGGERSGSEAPAGNTEEAARGRASAPARPARSGERSTRLTRARPPARHAVVGAEPG